MKDNKEIIAGTSGKSLVPFFILSFLIWIFCFRGFLFNRLTLTSDALAYVEHFKFFLDQISRGVYPLWEPGRDLGTPIEFFLRRIGSFNPAVLLVWMIHKLGVPYVLSYLGFLGLYYFFGLVGFYLTAKALFEDRYIAFGAYLLLMFSSLGTRLFDSYFLLTMVPMAWLFYFLLAFAKYRLRHHFLGMTLALMVLVTTYIPFYFFTIVASFIIFYALFYFRDLTKILGDTLRFVKGNRLLTAFCLLAFLLSLLPGIIFFSQTDKGEVVFPQRHYNSTAVNTLEVDYGTITQWGIEEDILYSKEFTDLRKFKFAILYVPVFGFLILSLGVLMGASKRLVFLFSWGLAFLLVFCYHAPIYQFLFDRIFYFKYFRNLHFFPARRGTGG